MEGGRVVDAGERDAVLEQPQHEYIWRLLAASPALSVTGDAAAPQPTIADAGAVGPPRNRDPVDQDRRGDVLYLMLAHGLERQFRLVS